MSSNNKLPESYGFTVEFYQMEGSTNIKFSQKFPKNQGEGNTSSLRLWGYHYPDINTRQEYYI
jgi:hypothetical protein